MDVTVTKTPESETTQTTEPAGAAEPSLAAPDLDRFIEIAGLVKTFPGDGAPVHALRGLDLTVREGTFLGVMGQSGSGKSTFLSILGGLSHPTDGSVKVDGIELYSFPASVSQTSAASTSASSSSPSTWCPT